MKGKGSTAVESISEIITNTDVMYVPENDKHLLCVGQLLEKGFEVHFEDKMCVIKDAKALQLFSAKIKRKSFQLDLMDKE